MHKSLYIHNQFYAYVAIVVGVFLISYFIPTIFSIALLLLGLLSILVLFDIFILYRFKKAFKMKRFLPVKFSNSDENVVQIELSNNYPFEIHANILDELPVQFQKRDFRHQIIIPIKDHHHFEYSLRPVDRGAYHFGKLHVFVSSSLKIVSRRYSLEDEQTVAVYPSYIQMRKYEFLAISNKLSAIGLKKIRRIGHTMEFEQIKNYVPGDDVRTINWKATAKRADLMVNQYQDEKSQPIYSIIDTGRVMKMPFDGLKLLDYAINATLAFSNIALLKNDKAGMLTFSKKVDNLIVASNKKTHLNVINETLYAIDTQFTDSDFGLLYASLKRKVNHRSLVILYTNFEHISGLKRQLPYLKAIARKHLLVTVFFENTALEELIAEPVEELQEVYHQTIAEKFVFEKKLMVKELNQHGIHGILTKPEELSVNVINQYLSFKAKGLI